MPITPPFSAILRIASSVLQRGCSGLSARQFAWVISTGALRVVHAHQFVGVMRDESIPMTDERRHLVIGIRSDGSDRDIHHINSRFFETLKIGQGKSLRIPEPRWPFVTFERRQHPNER